MCDKNAFLAVGVGAGATAVIVAVLHWLQSLGLASSDVVPATLPVAVAVIVAVGCWALLLWLFWQTRLDPKQPGYALTVVLSVVMICVSLEALAGMSALLWLRGVSLPATSGAPSLWRAEGHYLWHLVDSIPLLSAPRTLGWRDPQPFTDYISGALLLAFKVAIIAPLIRLGLSGYQFYETSRGQVMAKHEEKQKRRQEERWKKQAGKRLQRGMKLPDWQSRSGESFWFLPVLMGLLGVAVVAMVVLADPGSWANHWLASHWLDRLPSEVSVRNVHLSLGWLHAGSGWLHAGSPWLPLVALILLIGMATSLLDGVSPDNARSAPAVAGTILTYLVLLALLTLVAAAISLALLRIGVAIARPKIPSASQPQAAVNSYAWAIADALPGPDIPRTLNWTLQYRFVDHWSKALLFLYKIAFVMVLLFPVYRTLRVYTASRPAAAVEPSLSAAQRFLNSLLTAQKALDRLQGWSVSMRPQKDVRSFYYLAARHALDDLESALEDVRSLFGDSDVASKAYAAESSARDRFERSTIMSYGAGLRPTPIDRDERQALDRDIDKYSRSASETLHNAANEQQLYRAG
jgi:hypothetical protein